MPPNAQRERSYLTPMFSWFSKLFVSSAPTERYQPAGTWHLVPPGAQTIRQFRTALVGVRFANADGTSRQKAIRSVPAGKPLRLLFEDNNPKDPNAVAVYAGNLQLGYIKAELAAEIRLDASRDRFADVTAYQTTNDVWTNGKRHFGLIVTLRKSQMPLPAKPAKSRKKKEAQPHSQQQPVR